LTADNTEAEKNVELTGARRYIRAVTTVTFTGGASPTIPVAATLTLAGRDLLPA
jgi:hypothetical protein